MPGISESWRIPNAMWERIEPLLPPEKPLRTNGRPVVPFRRVLDAIFYVLRTGCQWKALPTDLCSGSVAHARFQEWTRSGVFLQLWQEVLREYDELKGIDWEWQSLDGAMTKAPLGGKRYGAQPHGSREIRGEAASANGR